MLINLTPQNPTPLYLQIVEQVKNKILQGELAAHEPLPSIRQLARELTTSVITTKRAYEELEREGLIYTRAGKGSFVAPVDRSEQYRRLSAQLQEQLEAVIKEAVAAGIEENEIKNCFKKALAKVRGRN